MRFNDLLMRLICGPSFITMASTFLRVGSGLFTLPLALRTIPAEQLGLYYTFMAISGLAMLVDFGFSQSVGRNAAYAVGGATSFSAKGVPSLSDMGSPNWKLLGELKDAVQKWYLLISVILGVLLVTVGGFFIKNRIEEGGLPFNLLICWFVFSLTSAYGLANLFWGSLLVGIGSVRAAAKIGLASQCVGIVITIVGLYLGVGIWVYAISGVASAVISRIWSEKALLKDAVLPDVRADRAQVISVFEVLWPMAWRQGVVMIGAFLIQRGNTIVCSSKLGLEETSRYGLSLYLLNIIFQVSIIPLSLTWPIIGRLRVSGETIKIREVFFKRLYLGLAFAIFGVVGAAFILPSILNLMGSQTALLSTSLFCVLGLILMLEVHHSAYASLVISVNENPFMIPAIVSGIAILAVSWWSAERWGVWGLILSQGLIQALWNNWWTVLRGLKSINVKEVKVVGSNYRPV